jgi:drug/metabolite transporter (DMT)-like permease
MGPSELRLPGKDLTLTPQTDGQRLLWGAIFGLTAAAIWGGMYVVSDVVLTTIPPFTLLSLRLILGAAVLGGVIALRQERASLTRRDALRVLGVGLIGFGVSVGAQFVGTDKSTAVNGVLITSASPAFILIFAVLILRERLSVRHVAAVALATLGVAVIIDPARADFGSQTFLGNLALCAAALTWGLYSVLVRQVSATADTTLVTLVCFLGGLILTIPASVLELSAAPIGPLTPGTLAGVAYIGLISTAVAMWLWNRAFALVDASIASLFFFAQPLVGALLSVIFLGQQMTFNLWIGGFLIVAGLLLSLSPRQRRSDAT